MGLSDHIRKSPHRNLLERHIARVFPTLEAPILEVGSRNRRYDHLLRTIPVAIDLTADEKKDIQRGDVTSLAFADQSFNAVVCLEVLEYVAEPKRAIDEMHRVLVPGGILFLSIPFMFKMHEDKQRYTALHLTELLSRFDVVSLDAVGGGYTVILTILWGTIKKISFSPLRKILSVLLVPFIYPQYLRKRKSIEYASGYVIVAKKRL